MGLVCRRNAMGLKQPVCLVHPELAAQLPYPHLGIPSLVAYLAANGHADVGQLDLSSPGSTPPWDLLTASALVGISIAYPQQLVSGLSLARRIRSANPNAMIIAGGSTVTARIHSLIKTRDLRVFDGLVAGDGEEPLRMICERVKQNSRDLSGVPNCYFRTDHGFVPPSSTFLMTPDQYPTPRFAMRQYGRLPIRMAKGCFWRKCVFCTYRSVFDGYLPPSIEAGVRQIQELSARHGTRRFVIIDDGVPARILKAFADTLVQRGIKVDWDCSAIFDRGFRDPAVAQSLARGGCRTIFFGFESANVRVLRLMGKINDPQTVLAALTNLSSAGIRCHLNVIIGFPSETRPEAQETIDFLRQNRRLFGNFHAQTFCLEERTDVYRTPEKFGVLRIGEEACEELSGRVGSEFACVTGMNGTQRRFMTLKCQVAYRKEGMSLAGYLRRKLELYAYAARHPLGMLLNR